MALSLTGCLARWYSSTGAIHGNGRAGFQRQTEGKANGRGLVHLSSACPRASGRRLTMPRTRLARAALATAVLSVPVAGLMALPAGTASAAAQTASPTSGASQEVAVWRASTLTFNQQVAAYVK